MPSIGESARHAGAVTREAMVQSALLSAKLGRKKSASPKNRIILSAKVSAVQELDHRLQA